MRKFFSNLGRLVIGTILMVLIFALGIWTSVWSIRRYNHYAFGPRLANQIEASRITYYVSPNGNDANDGKSPATAWQTIAKVNQINFKPADQILFEGGQTFAGNLKFDSNDTGTPSNPIKISSYGEKRAIIQAENQNGISILNSMGFEISNLKIVGSGRDLNQGDGISVVNDLHGDLKLEDIKINSAEISNFGKYGIRIEGKRGKSGFRNVLIENVEAHNNVLAGVYILGQYASKSTQYAHQNVTIKRVKAYKNSGKEGVWFKNTGSGIVLSDVDGGLIEQSMAFENGWLCNSKQGGPVGIWAWDSNNIVIQNNESYANKTGGNHDGGGFDFDGGMKNSVMQYNYSHDNDGAGFLLMQFSYARPWTNNIVRYNISENDGRKNSYGGIQFWGDTQNAFVYNNTVVTSPSEKATPRAIVFRPNDEGSNVFPQNVKVANNIFVTSGKVPLIESAVDEKSISFQGNNYFSNDSNWQVSWNNTTFSSLDEWSVITGQERTTELTGFSVNPNFTDCGKNDFFSKPIAYCLSEVSPLIDKGIDLRNAYQIETGEKDFRGKKMPVSNYDIGAIEAEK